MQLFEITQSVRALDDGRDFKNMYAYFFNNINSSDLEAMQQNLDDIKKHNSRIFRERREALRLLSVKYSNVYERLKFFSILEFFKFNMLGFHIPHYMDFRGRNYSRSFLSPINSKLARSCYHYGYYTEDDLLIIEKKLPYSKSYLLIKEFFYLLDNLNIVDRRPIVLSSLVWFFVELGKFSKTKLSINGEVTLLSFIQEGMRIFFGEKLLFLTDMSDIFYFNKLMFYTADFIKGNYTCKVFLLKDSTASVLQHLFK